MYLAAGALVFWLQVLLVAAQTNVSPAIGSSGGSATIQNATSITGIISSASGATVMSSNSLIPEIYSGASTSGSPNFGLMQVINVGSTNGSLEFSPNSTVAQVGDVVQFQAFGGVSFYVIAEKLFLNSKESIDPFGCSVRLQ
jgi:plastocyanin